MASFRVNLMDQDLRSLPVHPLKQAVLKPVGATLVAHSDKRRLPTIGALGEVAPQACVSPMYVIAHVLIIGR
jgi:hypothetical protein